MKKLYDRIESRFEKLSELSTRILGNSIVFMVVLTIVGLWFVMVLKSNEDLTGKIRDCFIAVSFLIFFLVQRNLNKYNRAIHLKLNELVKIHDKASDDLINIEQKTHKEMEELAKELHEK